MLISYEVSASDAGTAINIAEKRAMRDGYSHVSVNSTYQLGPTRWVITIFGSNSQGVTRRGPAWVNDAQGGHWCPSPSLCQH